MASDTFIDRGLLKLYNGIYLPADFIPNDQRLEELISAKVYEDDVCQKQ